MAGPERAAEIEPKQRPCVDKETNRSIIGTGIRAVKLIFCLYYGSYVELYFGKNFNDSGKTVYITGSWGNKSGNFV